MSVGRRILNLYRYLFNRNRVERDFDEELRSYLDVAVQEKIKSGVSPDEARRKALIELGGQEQVKEADRAARLGSGVESLLQDVRYTLRRFRKEPGFTAILVLTLAVGIGANTAIYSVANSVIFRPLPYKDSDRYVRLEENRIGALFGTMGRFAEVHTGYLKVIAERSRTLSHIAAYGDVYWPRSSAMTVTGLGEPVRLAGKEVSSSLFPMLGADAFMGRVFKPADEQPGSEKIVLLSYKTWRNVFNSDKSVLGRTLRFDEKAYSVIGVMPEGFEFPERDVDFWFPLIPAPSPIDRAGPWTAIIASVKEGVTLDAAAKETSAIIEASLGSETVTPAIPGHGESSPISNSKPQRIELVSIKEELVGPLRPAFAVLGIAVGFVLLIACSNIASLLLVRASARQQEMAIRAAIGAGRSRLMRQCLIESLAVALLGGVAGLLLAYGGVQVIRQLAAGYLPRISESRIDSSALVFTLMLTVLAGLAFGLFPAFHASRKNNMETIREGDAAASSGFGLFRRYGARSVLVIAQIATVMVLLVGAGLLLRSFLLLTSRELGFDPWNLLTFQVALPQRSTPPLFDAQTTVEEWVGYFALPPIGARPFAQQLLARLKSLPGVDSVAAATCLPLTGCAGQSGIAMDGFAAELDYSDLPNYSVVSEDYFHALGIRVVSSRTFRDQDPASEPNILAMVNQAMVRRYFAGQNPIGKNLVQEPPRPSFKVIGIVEDVRQIGLDSLPRPEIYWDMRYPRRMPEDSLMNHWGGLYFAVRTTHDNPKLLIPSVRNLVQQIDPRATLELNVAAMDERLSNSVSKQRFYAVLVGAFAGIAAILAAIGIYGVMSHTVARRTQEIGIRVALGAQYHEVVLLVLRQGIIVILVGILLGLAGAAAMAQYLDKMLFGVTSLDPITFAAVAVLFVLISALSCFLPARRAAKIDPLIALRRD